MKRIKRAVSVVLIVADVVYLALPLIVMYALLFLPMTLRALDCPSCG
ncbi:MAG: hypothetical protein REI11_20975 [Patulibacter sp.]|nr:hypothetical protein [Patulibacter sp.]